MKIRTFFAVLLCKLARGLLRLLRRGGTAFPGRVALKVYPQVLGVLSQGVRVILVTGTNGKTTSSRMIEQAFADAGLNYFANRSGANLISGITAEFAMHSTLTGRPKCQFAVIECDEAASKTVLKYLKPEAIVATNVFRDQLDRYGEITHTLNNIIEGIRHTPESAVHQCRLLTHRVHPGACAEPGRALRRERSARRRRPDGDLRRAALHPL